MAYSKRPMRRSALIGPWGVGAIVPFPNDEALMIAGLDAWRYQDASPFVIVDERLTKRLGVKELRWPPDFREKNADPRNCNLTIPTVRFPRWYYCPFCGSMTKTTYYRDTQPRCDQYQWENGRVCKPGEFKRRMIPERFVVICPEGHIDDFPVEKWVHNCKGDYTYNENTCRIRRSTGGSSANLSGVFYECTCGAKRSLKDAMTKGALARSGYRCHSSKPWLGIEGDELCNASPNDVKVVLRGATNVWFADTRSSIYIPTDDTVEKSIIKGIVKDNFDQINANRVDGKINRVLTDFLAGQNHVDKEQLYQAFIDEANIREGEIEITPDISEDEYRLQEYKVLIKSSGNDLEEFHSINYPIEHYNSAVQKYFKSISLVPKLKETRAFVGFSRLDAPNKSIAESKKELRLGNADWLPAIEVFGEGIFIEFNEEQITRWAEMPSVKSRIAALNSSYHKAKFGANDNGDLRPEYVLIHTFAHLIINQLSFDCGYGSSSIRERIYCEKTSNDLKMYGVLLYTASGDSEGSLGGLVRQGETGRIEDTIKSALENATWCTSDPVCIQSLGQGPESLNLAACHNCTLLPETCCEVGNRLLDRGVVIGTLKDKSIGYFSEMLKPAGD